MLIHRAWPRPKPWTARFLLKSCGGTFQAPVVDNAQGGGGKKNVGDEAELVVSG